ncbi:FAD-dependent oxidoreductase [Lentilactobacillus senioris]|uniref:FAD-dependent oxidoreductase n=1 Tax=Lentilactobacillus senioris TaxID=931534 RepID=UPI00227EA656|nr:FAD-dependent oxidoreductase [Lentilactobacillus senioris]MCY9806372.1 FAD-dependent oxidoreductase [Lentilactobacillus senioris]
MGKNIIVIGGVAGGASVAARARRLDESANVTMFEKGPNVSFSNCALPYHLSGTIADANDIVLMDPKQFKAQYNINAVVNHEVVDIDSNKQEVVVKDVLTGELENVSYDELFLSPGADPILPSNIKGINGDNVFTIRNVEDIKAIKSFLDEKSVKNVSVIGGGFIGIETAENLKKGGYNVSLVEGMDHILGTIDYDMAQIVQKTMLDNGVDVIVDDVLTEIDSNSITLKSGKKLDSEAVIMSVGVKPATALAQKAGVELGVTGAIKVDQHYQTNLPHVYAVGDAIELVNRITRKPTKLNLAFPAQLEARQAVDHIYGREVHNRGIIGSQCIPVFEMNVASTGLTEKQCQEAEIDYEVAVVIPKDKVALMPNAKPLYFKLIFGNPSGEILGAQAIGESSVDKQIDVIATMITNHNYVEDLETLELCYQPTFSTAKNAVNMAGLVATNLLNGEYKQVTVDQVRPLVEAGATIIDARESFEYEEGHIKGAKNIPMSEFRDRLSEIPTDKPVYIHCLSGQRSYNVVRALVNMGYTNIYNISGSYLDICEYEYFMDQTTDREPIVTNYRFDLL